MNIKEAIQEILKNEEEIYSIVGEVTDVDESARTVDVQPNDESAELFGVLLQANADQTNGFVNIPSLNSQVVVTFLSKEIAFVSLFTEVDKVLIDADEITLNGGTNGGLIVLSKLITKINRLENIINSHVHTGNLGAPTSPQLTPIVPLTLAVDLENTKIKH
jgi:hypothetical protein